MPLLLPGHVNCVPVAGVSYHQTLLPLNVGLIEAHLVARELETVVPKTLRPVQCGFCWGSESDDDESGTREPDEPGHLKLMISLHRAQQARYMHK